MLTDISKHLHVKEGFCHPDGAAISTIIEQNHPEAAWPAAWETIFRLWLDRIRKQWEAVGRSQRWNQRSD